MYMFPSGFLLDYIKLTATATPATPAPCDVDGFVAGVKNVLRLGRGREHPSHGPVTTGNPT